jgi:Fic family protein
MSYQPEYTITNKMMTAVANAQAAREIIDNAPLVPSWERSFQSQAIARSVHHSTAIEGNALNLQETEKIISGEEIESYRTRDIMEIINYRKVIKYISEFKGKNLDMNFLFKIHALLGDKILSSGFLGVFRTENALVINSQSGEVVFDAVSPLDLEDEISQLIAWDTSVGNCHPLLRAGVLHFELVRIHPFVDLNGRTARIVATWSLYRDGFDFKKFFSLEEYYDQDLSMYYDAIDSAHSGDLTKWLEYFTQGVAEELGRVKDKVLALSMDRRLKQKVGQVALNERQIKIIDYLETNREIKNPDFNDLFPNVSDDTVLRDLNDLQEKKIIAKKGRTRGARYILT